MRLIKEKNQGFTIIELLVVIVVIGVLAAITIVSYTGINQKAIAASLQADLSTWSQQLKMYNTDYGTYPQTFTGNCPTSPVSDSRYCLRPSQGNTITYCPVAPFNTFMIKDTNSSGLSYITTDNSQPSSVATIFPSGGTITSAGCTRTHTFGTSCTSGSPCVITATASGTVAVSILGGGGGGGAGDDTDGYAGNPGNAGGNSTLTYAGTTYIANGGGGGGSGGIGGNGCPGLDGSIGSTSAFSLNGDNGKGSNGGFAGDYVGSCNGGKGGNGGKVSGNLSIISGSIISIVVGSGGAGGQNLGGGGTGGNGDPGLVTVSYTN